LHVYVLLESTFRPEADRVVHVIYIRFRNRLVASLADVLLLLCMFGNKRCDLSRLLFYLNDL